MTGYRPWSGHALKPDWSKFKPIKAADYRFLLASRCGGGKSSCKNTPLAESGLNVLWTTYIVRKMITFQEPNQKAAY